MLVTYTTKFLNHASFYFEDENEIIVIDPWFFGKIFDNSWSLLQETSDKDITISKIKHIFITHEHPDHLHWGTLKFISDQSNESIKVYFTQRQNKNVRDNLTKLGFHVVEIPPHSRQKLNGNFYYTQFPFGHDSAFVFEVDNKVHFNQNDCYLDNYNCAMISAFFPQIDYWWMQFSLAGYYANRDDIDGLQAAKDFHIQAFEKYYKTFKPTVAIPFASHVYFCKKYNSYLNEWAVSIEELRDACPEINMCVPFYGDLIDKCDNSESIKKWNHLASMRHQDIDEPLKVSDDKITTPLNQWLKGTHNNLPYDKIVLNFFDDNRNFVLDFDDKKCFFTNDVHKIAGTLTREGLLCFAKFPWGADTLNITSCFDVQDSTAWKFLLQYKDSSYVR